MAISNSANYRGAENLIEGNQSNKTANGPSNVSEEIRCEHFHARRRGGTLILHFGEYAVMFLVEDVCLYEKNGLFCCKVAVSPGSNALKAARMMDVRSDRRSVIAHWGS